MTTTATLADTLRSFVQLVTAGQPPSLLRLARALDELAMLVHHNTAGKLSDSDVAPPRWDYDAYKALYDTLARRFPELSRYIVADPIGDLSAEPMSGDPIDDLADIVGDLRDVIWRDENAAPEEALWYFHFHFQSHWGRHLRELSLYLHALMCGQGTWDEHYAEEADG